MGFRFRKSVKIAPGIKVNLSKSGASVSLGRKGITTNVSQRGIRNTYSIPGTGISYVTQTSFGRTTKSNSSHTGSSSIDQCQDLLNYQDYEENGEQLSLQDKAPYQYLAFQERIAALTNILGDREQASFDWDSVTASRGKYQPGIFQAPPFSEPIYNINREELLLEVRKKFFRPYSSYFLLTIALILVIYNFWISLIAFWLLIINFICEKHRLDKRCNQRLQVRLREENEKNLKQREILYKEYQLEVIRQKSQHEKNEKFKQQAWDQEEQYRKRLGKAIKSADLEPLEKLLETELKKQKLPVPFIFNLDLVDVNQVQIFIQMPSLELVPKEELYLTKKGRLSSKAMSQESRLKLYSDVCTGLALRATHELLRIVQAINLVEVFGFSDQVSSENGQSEKTISLQARLTRQEFQQFDLDSLDPTSAFIHLNGKFACSMERKLMPL